MGLIGYYTTTNRFMEHKINPYCIVNFVISSRQFNHFNKKKGRHCGGLRPYHNKIMQKRENKKMQVMDRFVKHN
jgi:hypothetical protein